MTRRSLIVALVLAGCADDNLGDLRAFVELRPPDRALDTVDVEDPRGGAPAEPVVARNPFARASQPTAGIPLAAGPDPHRVPGPLEQHPVGRLQMVGTLAGRGSLYALVRDPEGRTHRATTDDHLGRDHGRIVAVHEDRIEFVELLADGTGWRHRPRSLAMGTGDRTPVDSGDP